MVGKDNAERVGAFETMHDLYNRFHWIAWITWITRIIAVSIALIVIAQQHRHYFRIRFRAEHKAFFLQLFPEL